MRLSYSINQIFTGTLLVALLSFGAALGQGSVTLKGLVTDKSTGEPLPGANLVVKGSSLGGAADIDGVYFIFNVPAGKRTVEVSYLGYQTLTVELDLSGSGSVQQNFALDASVVEGEVVVVTAQAQGQLAAINQQLASDKIANIVSEQRIQELPDFNAAAALSRLPGVSTVESSGEANKVVIRGLAPQFNAVAVEGVKLASTGSTQIGVTSQGGTSGSISNDRSVDLSMVTPYMIKTIQVYKSLTPDMDANAVGGSVNMELREAPSGWSTDLLFQSGYTDKSKNYGNFRTVISGSNRFYDDKLGAYVLFNAESYDRDADNMQANYGISQHQVGDNGFEPVRVRDVQLNRHLETRKRFGGNLILDYKLPNGSLKAINMFTRLNSDFDDYRSILNYTNKNLDFRYRGGENTIDLAVNSLNLDYDFNFMQMDMKFASTRSKNSLPEAPDIVFWQTGAIIGAIPENTIPDSLVQQIEYR
ncbi:MAG TPA: carboxypeptidase-like regulatory domain-containing protein, partial [Calditrichia bacterium]|nr:carboxypeptidase-like regulatory domain-containing protein [Calditrichia bacterium]